MTMMCEYKHWEEKNENGCSISNLKVTISLRRLIGLPYKEVLY